MPQVNNKMGDNVKSMLLKQYKEKTGKSYREIAKESSVDHNVIHRICTLTGYCPRLNDAHKLVVWAKGEVDYSDLLGDC